MATGIFPSPAIVNQSIVKAAAKEVSQKQVVYEQLQQATDAKNFSDHPTLAEEFANFSNSANMLHSPCLGLEVN